MGKIKPFLHQFMVSAGVSLSVMEHSLVMGFTTIILPQLRENPIIVLNDTSASWIASIVPLSTISGFLFVLTIIDKYGRRYSNLIGVLLMVLGWLCISLATNFAAIFIGRFIHGVGMGVSSLTGAILIGEYTTPKYRGAFLTMMTFTMLSGGLVVHTIGSCFTWHNTAFFCLGIAVTDSILVLLSPESPMFLATCGKYDKCREVFHWLRGFDEEEELEAMIKKAEISKAVKKRACPKLGVQLRNTIRKSLLIFKKSEFYKPLILMAHLFICNAWCGAIMMDAYGVDIFRILIGKDVNITFMLLSMDILRIVSALIATVLNTKIRRRLMIKIFITLNIIAYFITAAYYYVKVNNWLPYDHHTIGAALVYILTFSVGVGTVPIVSIISGEIFPLEYKNVCTVITTLFLSMSIAIKMKTLTYLFSIVGLHGAYCIYGAIIAYGMIVALILLPETKDMTLQNIEELYWMTSKFNDMSVAIDYVTKTEELHELVSIEGINEDINKLEITEKYNRVFLTL